MNNNALWAIANEIKTQATQQEQRGEDMSFARRAIVRVSELAFKRDREFDLIQGRNKTVKEILRRYKK